jgi:hypothetical protein
MTIADGLNITAFAKIAIPPMISALDPVPSSIMLTPRSWPVLRASFSTVRQEGEHLSLTIMGIAGFIGTMPPGMGYLERTSSPQRRHPSQQRHYGKCASIGTPVVRVCIKIAAVIVGIAAIKSIQPKSTSKAFEAKTPTMKPAGELMKSSTAEGAVAKTTAEGAPMETASEAAAMESTTTTVATATAPSQRFVVGHQDRSEQGADNNHFFHLTSSVALVIATFKRPEMTIVIPGSHVIVTTILS